jgi:hypothetical protein
LAPKMAAQTGLLPPKGSMQGDPWPGAEKSQQRFGFLNVLIPETGYGKWETIVRIGFKVVSRGGIEPSTY